MLLAGMTRLPEGAVGNDLLSGRAAAAAKKRMLECWDRKTDIPDTHCLTPPSPSPPHPSAATTTPGTAHTSGWQIVNLAPLELMFFSTPLILICFQSPLSPSLLLPFIFSVFPRFFSPSLPLYHSFSPTCSWGSKHQIEHLGNRCHLGKCWSSSRVQWKKKKKKNTRGAEFSFFDF